ncbi:MAG: S8 family serine peptidase [Acidobacteria bacterium]|nr:S8 family serine peptidase [Acidobacteriota bacterium]
MPTNSEPQQFILLPPRGMTTSSVPSNPQLTSFLISLDSAVGNSARRVSTLGVVGGPGAGAKGRGEKKAESRGVKMRVLDSIHEDGAKLIEIAPENISDLRAEQPGMRIVPVVFFTPALAPRPPIELPVKPGRASGVSVKITLKIVSRADGKPIAGADVVAFTDFKNREGADGTTNKNGEVRLSLGGSSKKLQRLYVFPRMSFWGLLKKNITVTSGKEFSLRPIDLNFTDAKRFFYGDARDGAGASVKVGVIDTGIAPHLDLVIDGGFNAVLGEPENEFGDNGDGHGTHVAGIIAARGLAPAGVRGIAPGVTLRSYRVFGKNKHGASNFAIAKAIDRAVADGCDLINMSLSGPDPDEATSEAIAEARAQGVVVLAAAGNDDRSAVGFPAADSLAIAVSAMGRKETFPADSSDSGDVAAPFGKPDKKNFIASFSNIGPEIDLTGPGVGIISTFPDGYAVLGGTSMACPAMTGVAARLLASTQHASILSMGRNQARSDAMAQVILQAAKSFGFGPIFEGRGMVLVS